jgi:hypothetical protein
VIKEKFPVFPQKNRKILEKMLMIEEKKPKKPAQIPFKALLYCKNLEYFFA